MNQRLEKNSSIRFGSSVKFIDRSKAAVFGIFTDDAESTRHLNQQNTHQREKLIS